MKQINFNHAGGFPLEQETLERIQTAYRSELYDALKRHLSIETGTNYILATPTSEANGWAIIHQYENNQKDPEESRILQGILYPIVDGTPTDFLKTTRIGTNLIYGTGASKTAYFDYEAAYVSQEEYSSNAESSQNNDELTIYYYDLRSFETVLDLQSIQEIFQSIRNNIYAVEGNINAIENNINTIEADINLINQSYLPLNGSKAMQGDLDLGIYHLSKLDTLETFAANVRAVDFKFGSKDRRGKFHPNDYPGRALADSSTDTETSLTLNYDADWENTQIGGKVYLNNISSSASNGSLLVLDNQNQVVKSNTLIESLIDRITVLENKPTTAVPIGMVAIWGKPAPFPEGWEEYVPLAGRMPVGLDTTQMEFDQFNKAGGAKNKTLSVSEIPSHSHGFKAYTQSGSNDGSGGEAAGYFEDSTTNSTGGGQQFSLLNPYRVVQFIEYTGRPTDITAPTAPVNLTVSNVTNSRATLTWQAATDDVAVTSYLVYQNGIFLIELGPNTLAYYMTGLLPGTSYNFSVKAKDKAGNVSSESEVKTIVTTNVTKPLYIDAYIIEGNQIMIYWDFEVHSGTTPTYELYRKTTNGTWTMIKETPALNYIDTGAYETKYYYKVLARDADGVSDSTGEISITTDPRDISCFDIESLVTMASGQSKKLKNVVVGDKLQGLTFPNEIDESEGDYMLWNGLLSEATKVEVTVVNKITSVQPDYYEIKTEDAVIKATGQHPLLITEDGENLRWVCIKNVVQNMLLIDKSGQIKTIESITFKEEPLEVALLDVESVDNYVISGIVAHNNKPLDPQ
ncbi:fibronectin type III domain-containing protein [Flavobacterium anhuiense]|uniref:fibronectin type III domain-containing protein n=1 Tax=Flavobacterium anhuiense TaxID=459526 RepID=UPI003D957F32